MIKQIFIAIHLGSSIICVLLGKSVLRQGEVQPVATAIGFLKSPIDWTK
jgi:hypothetical protein